MGDEHRPHDAYPVRTVARLTGLSPDLIRAWERRYSVVAPVRGPRGARLYTAADIARLKLLARVVASGRAIGDVARLDTAALEALLANAPAGPALPPAAAASHAVPPGPVGAVLAAIERLDAAAVETHLGDALVALGTRAFVRDVVAPLLHEIGERWGAGTLSIGAEHLASGLLRNLLGSLIRARAATGGRTVLLATPSGERHELGLLLVSLLLRDAGLGVHYLGCEVPAGEIVSAAHRAGVAAVGLGVVDGGNRTRAVEEVQRVAGGLAPAVQLWLGGREAAAVAAASAAGRIVVLDDLDRLDRAIEVLRQGAPAHR